MAQLTYRLRVSSSPGRGARTTRLIHALPLWMQEVAMLSPALDVLAGMREALLDHVE